MINIFNQKLVKKYGSIWDMNGYYGIFDMNGYGIWDMNGYGIFDMNGYGILMDMGYEWT